MIEKQLSSEVWTTQKKCEDFWLPKTGPGVVFLFCRLRKENMVITSNSIHIMLTPD